MLENDLNTKFETSSFTSQQQVPLEIHRFQDDHNHGDDIYAQVNKPSRDTDQQELMKRHGD